MPELSNNMRLSGSAENTTQRARLPLKAEHFLVSITLLVFIILGVIFTADYGESWDEKQLIIYADTSLDAYAWWGNGHQWNKDFYGPSNHRYYGPAYLMLARIVSNELQRLPLDWPSIANWHFVIYLTYVFTIYCLYALIRRFVSTKAALGSALLFASQPLLWGHAFINPKDIPFMAFFIASILFGFQMADHLVAEKRKPPTNCLPLTPLQKALTDNYRTASYKLRKTLSILIGLAVVILTLRTIGAPLVNRSLSLVVDRAYHAEPASLLGKFFANIAQHAGAIPVSVYIDKSARFVYWVEGVVLNILLAGIVLLGVYIFLRTRENFKFKDYIPTGLKDFTYSLTNGRLLAASVFLGISTSIRMIGPAAGLLVALYFLIIARRRALIPLTAYFLVSAGITYFTWPYLWIDPFRNFYEAAQTMASFPFPLEVLFSGHYYAASDLPRIYFPQLLAFQFTLPALALALGGLAIIILKLVRKQVRSLELGLLLGWFFAPFSLALIFQPPMYDNFRQFFFIIPPLFLLIGFCLEALIRVIPRKLVQLALLGLLIAPGIYWGARLHPYEYTYYNMLTGGLAGAYRQYETDYWATSFQEAVEYVNQVAPEGATIAVSLPAHIAVTYARPDLKVVYYFGSKFDPSITADFAIAATRLDFDQQVYPEYEVVYQVRRGEAVFAVVKQPAAAQD
jgi:hypothetical protein